MLSSNIIMYPGFPLKRQINRGIIDMDVNKLALCLSGMFILSAVSPAGVASAQETEAGISFSPAVISVETTYAGEDVNAENFKEALNAWCAQTGCRVDNRSANSNEMFKEMVREEFASGTEPDVLFFFTGADANSFIAADEVVPVDRIREDYPEYASNMNDDLIPVSLVDGRAYSVPVNGFWEGLYYNSEILKESGAEVPGTGYTMEQFIKDCRKIKKTGYIPIAASLGEIPHYWWEYMIFNQQTPKTHDLIPQTAGDETGQQWVRGIETVKKLYGEGFFPDNTLSISNMDTVSLMVGGKAAFLLDGSWRLGSIVNGCLTDPDDQSSLDEDKLDKFGVAYCPGDGKRKATDIIGGMSMGYYISRRAYEDPDKRDAAVNFVEYMTSDKVVMKFASHTATALKNPPKPNMETLNSLQLKAVSMVQESTSITPAVQDLYLGECRSSTFDGMPELVTGRRDIADAVEEGLEIYHSQVSVQKDTEG